MDKEQAKKLKDDKPLSLTDAAPPIVTLECGAEARIPAGPDYRIVSKVYDAVEQSKDEQWDDNFDEGVLLLYCALHVQKKQISDLWKQARKPLKLYRDALRWFNCQPGTRGIDAMNEIMEYQAELDEEAELDGDDAQEGEGSGKKTGSQ